jgi:glycosyltransferase involved in cell wall biosynthesis
MISAVIISCNEAKELERCLKSIERFVDEIVIVDLHSNDGSEEVFKKFNVKVYPHERVPYADPIRNWAIEKAKSEWVLMLDPDEEVPETLIDRLHQILKEEPNKYSAVNIPFKNIFWGHWIAHTNFWPDKHLRIFKKGKLSWQDRVHSYPKVEGQILELPADPKLAIIHYGYNKRLDFFRKQMRYAMIEANNRYKSGAKFSVSRLVWLPVRECLARFIKHQGYKDGIDGLYLVLCLMWYRVMVEVYLFRKK